MEGVGFDGECVAGMMRAFHDEGVAGRMLAFRRDVQFLVSMLEPGLRKVETLDTAVELAKASGGAVRLINVIPMTPVMLAEYVPPDFDVQQRGSAEEALEIVARESGLEYTIS